MHIAAAKGHTAVARVLLEAGADANVAADDGETPLQVAAQCGHLAVVKVLLEAGADAIMAADNGVTPL